MALISLCEAAVQLSATAPGAPETDGATRLACAVIADRLKALSLMLNEFDAELLAIAVADGVRSADGPRWRLVDDLLHGQKTLDLTELLHKLSSAVAECAAEDPDTDWAVRWLAYEVADAAGVLAVSLDGSTTLAELRAACRRGSAIAATPADLALAWSIRP